MQPSFFVSRCKSSPGRFFSYRTTTGFGSADYELWPALDDAAICAMARVQNHYYLQFSDGEGLRAMSGVGLRFLRFLPEAGASLPADCLH